MLNLGFSFRLAIAATGVRGFAKQRAVLRALCQALALEELGEPRPATLLRGAARSSWRCRIALALAKITAQQPLFVAGGALAVIVLTARGIATALRAAGLGA